MTDQSPRPAEKKKGIPPLVWIVLALLVAWAVIAFMQRGGTDVTPQGGTMPMAEQGPSVMPAAPATPEAPGTPAAVVNPPQE